MSILKQPGWLRVLDESLLNEARSFGSKLDKDLGDIWINTATKAGLHKMGNLPIYEKQKFLKRIVLLSPYLGKSEDEGNVFSVDDPDFQKSPELFEKVKKLNSIYPEIDLTDYFNVGHIALRYNIIMHALGSPDADERLAAKKLIELARIIFSELILFQIVNSGVSRRHLTTDEIIARREGKRLDPSVRTGLAIDLERDPRESARKWQKVINPKVNEYIADNRPPTDEELMNVDAATFKLAMAAILERMKIPTGIDGEPEAVKDIMEDYPALIDVVIDSTNPEDFLENLLGLMDSDDSTLVDVSQQIYQQVKPKFIRGGMMPSSPEAGKPLKEPIFPPGWAAPPAKKPEVQKPSRVRTDIDISELPSPIEVSRAFDAWVEKQKAKGRGVLASDISQEIKKGGTLPTSHSLDDYDEDDEEPVKNTKPEPKPPLSKISKPSEDEDEEIVKPTPKSSTAKESEDEKENEYTFYDEDEFDKKLKKRSSLDDEDDDEADDFDMDREDDEDDDEGRAYRESVTESFKAPVKQSTTQQLNSAMEERRRIQRHRYMIEQRYL